MNLADTPDVFAAEIRALQAMHAQAHHALTQWGLWSMDRYQIGPKEARTSVWDQFKRDGSEGYGEEEAKPVTDAPVKAEGPEREPYDEKLGYEIDQRIHGPGGLNLEQRYVLRIAYATRDIPEAQMPGRVGCLPHAFKERLADSLAFVARFV